MLSHVPSDGYFVRYSLDIRPPAAVLENCLETPGPKPFSTSCVILRFICSIGIFSDRETLEPLAVSLSFEDLLPRLTFRDRTLTI